MTLLHRVFGPVFGAESVPAQVTQGCHLEIEGGRIRSAEFHPGHTRTEPTDLLVTSTGGEARSLGPSLCLPAFVDGHTHLVGLGLQRMRPDLSLAGSKDEALALLEAWLVSHPGEEPVIAEGWDQSGWNPPESLEGADIDRLGSSRPIAARRVCGHIAAFNRAALVSLGDHWPGLDRARGTATEELPLALTRLWSPSVQEFDAAVEHGQGEALRHGVAWVHEMGNRSTWNAFRRAEQRGALRIRVSHFFRCEGAEARTDLLRFAVEGLGTERSEEFRDGERLRFAGIKFFLDGSIGARTAAVREPYPGPGGSGRLVWEDDALADALGICLAQDWPVAVHAIGDRATEQLLRVLECTGVPGGIGPRIEHAEMLPGDLQARAEALGSFYSMQPNFTANWQGPGGLYEQVLGPERARALNPYADALRSRGLLFGSDTMPLGPAHGLRGALGHPDPSQRLDLTSAVLAYTSGAARALRSPFHAARIAVGEPADLVFVSRGEGGGRDTGSGYQAESGASLEVVSTVLGGEVLFDRNGAGR